MKKISTTAYFESDLKKIWDIVTDTNNTSWRSDITRTEASEEEFTEYSGNIQTKFKIIAKEPYRYYALEISNKNLSGRWDGIFSPDGGGSKLDITEEITVSSPAMKLLAGVYLRRQQRKYISDLKRALGE